MSKASAIVSVASMLFGVIAVLLYRPRSRAREDSALFDGSTGGEEREGDGEKTRFCLFDPMHFVVEDERAKESEKRKREREEQRLGRRPAPQIRRRLDVSLACAFSLCFASLFRSTSTL